MTAVTPVTPVTALLVFAKEPVAGRAKTRLSPPLTPAGAARLAAAMLDDTLAAVAAVPAVRPVLVIDGDPGDFLPAGFGVIAQRGRGQAERLAAAFEEFQDLENSGGPALLIGMDTPQVTPALLAASARALEAPGVDAVLGPAADGGWWALGLRRPHPRALAGVPMSTPDTCRHQRRRLASLGLCCAELPALRDVDTIGDAVAVARGVPGSAFGSALAALLPSGPRGALAGTATGGMAR
ncbi:MAG TPA: DUF2064 domain-containing protein [Actinomycetota bacterium]|jgi:hypothetical protein